MLEKTAKKSILVSGVGHAASGFSAPAVDGQAAHRKRSLAYGKSLYSSGDGESWLFHGTIIRL
ncbi:hypothetical protein IE4872_CH00689 [Rhizobium gallicum]|uniref:Uncharacterized protein n=1 Tax=Rhizobium gallicum TaxID=56730 RepID=A0A1L5NEK9_9HYPH|nr:hypothetical protein [Rhizobium gallicum]APO66347.1 hypothetical protein IE4872_CH00689 [Rhizobium gallicum]